MNTKIKYHSIKKIYMYVKLHPKSQVYKSSYHIQIYYDQVFIK